MMDKHSVGTTARAARFARVAACIVGLGMSLSACDKCGDWALRGDAGLQSCRPAGPR